MEDDDVGLHRREIEIDVRALGQLLGEQPRIRVILRQGLHVVIERAHRSRREDADLFCPKGGKSGTGCSRPKGPASHNGHSVDLRQR